jgi:hypothetical protein
MTEHVPDPAHDEPAGAVGDQASDAGEDRGTDVEPLKDSDPVDQDSDDAGDDPVHGRRAHPGSG